MTRFPVLGLAALLFGGCVGTLEPLDNGGGGGGPDAGGVSQSAARQQFESNVSPMLSSTCAGCHMGTTTTGPNFLGSTGAPGYYTAITNNTIVIGNYDPTVAALLTHGSHDGGAAPAWTTTQAQTITLWLQAEAAERGL